AKDREGRFTLVNQAVAEAYGTTVESLLGKSDADFNSNAEEVAHFRRDDLEVMDTLQEKLVPLEPITDASGKLRWLQTIKRPILGLDGKATLVLGVATDVTQRKLAEDSLNRRSEEILRHQRALHELTLTSSPDGDTALRRIAEVAAVTLQVARVSLWLHEEDRSGIVCQCLHQNGVTTNGEGLKLRARDYPRYFSALEGQRTIAARDASTDPRTREFAADYLAPRGISSLLDVCIRLHGLPAGVVRHEQVGPAREWSLEEQHFAASIADLAALALGNSTRQQLEDQLRQSHKMEAIGALAGGVAHDFNNLLTAILGYCDLLFLKFLPDDPRRANVEEIRKAGERASTLTRQLLAFSRKQVLDPKVLDLNAVVSGMDGMLRRMIGEDVDLRTIKGEALWRVKADPSQLEMVLMNLVANGRDAMPGGGKLTIETMNVEVDEAYIRRRPYAVQGRYVLLAVSDSGSGMDPETVSHIFEPFFTTKEKGKGTGLGLSTVYGTVKQSKGHIQVYSERGIGTTFKVYIPAAQGELAQRASKKDSSSHARGSETLLIIEDERQVRELAREVLAGHGYKVLEASTGGEAIGICKAHPDPIQMVVTDVVMPGLSGRETYEQLVRLRPGLKVLYMSGYTQGAIVHRGVLEPGTAFVQKPFSVPNLLERVRSVLDDSRG
ncbi:MAG TPA: ATP-binding protein, partial [Candidatus Polarisedimenticolia bacterium]|nr:ATP-binding protein [Candidatus Polarisedimenticolia bacterium]